MAPKWPRALGVKGGLLLLDVKSRARSAERETLLGQARATLGEAFAGNALLKNLYEEKLREVEGR